MVEEVDISVCKDPVVTDVMGNGFSFDKSMIKKVNGMEFDINACKSGGSENKFIFNSHEFEIGKDKLTWKPKDLLSVYTEEQLNNMSEDERTDAEKLSYAEIVYTLPLTSAIIKDNCSLDDGCNGPIKPNTSANINYNQESKDGKTTENKTLKFPDPELQFLAIKVKCDQYVDEVDYANGINVDINITHSITFDDLGPNKTDVRYVAVNPDNEYKVSYSNLNVRDTYELRAGEYLNSKKVDPVQSENSMSYTYTTKADKNGVVVLKIAGVGKTSKYAKLNEDGKSAEITLRVDAKDGKKKSGADIVVVVDGSRSMDDDNDGKKVKHAQVDIDTLISVDKNGKETDNKEEIAYYTSPEAPDERFNSMGYNSRTRTYSAMEALANLDELYVDDSDMRGATVLFGSSVQKCKPVNNTKDNEDIYFVGDTSIPGTVAKDSDALNWWIYTRRMPFKNGENYSLGARKGTTSNGISFRYDDPDSKNNDYIGVFGTYSGYSADGGIGTNTQEALHAATEIFREDLSKHPENKDRRKIVILLSDGKPTSFPRMNLEKLLSAETIDETIGTKYGVQVSPGPWTEKVDQLLYKTAEPNKNLGLLYRKTSNGEFEPVEDGYSYDFLDNRYPYTSNFAATWVKVPENNIEKLSYVEENDCLYYQYKDIKEEKLYGLDYWDNLVEVPVKRPDYKKIKVSESKECDWAAIKKELIEKGYVKDNPHYRLFPISSVDYVPCGAYGSPGDGYPALPEHAQHGVISNGQFMVPIKVKAKSNQTVKFKYYDFNLNTRKQTNQDDEGKKLKEVEFEKDHEEIFYLRRNVIGREDIDGLESGKILPDECIYLEPPIKKVQIDFRGGKPLYGYLGEGWYLDSTSEDGFTNAGDLFDRDKFDVEVVPRKKDDESEVRNAAVIKAVLDESKLKNIDFKYDNNGEDIYWDYGGFTVGVNTSCNIGTKICDDYYDGDFNRHQIAYEDVDTYKYTYFDKLRSLEYDKLDSSNTQDLNAMGQARSLYPVERCSGKNTMLIQYNLLDNILEEKSRLEKLKLTSDENCVSQLSSGMGSPTLGDVQDVEIYSIATGLDPSSKSQEVVDGIKVMQELAGDDSNPSVDDTVGKTIEDKLYYNCESKDLPNVFESITEEMSLATCNKPIIIDVLGDGFTFGWKGLKSINGNEITVDNLKKLDESDEYQYQFTEKISDEHEIVHKFKVTKDEDDFVLTWHPSELKVYSEDEIKKILSDKKIDSETDEWEKEAQKLREQRFGEIVYDAGITSETIAKQIGDIGESQANSSGPVELNTNKKATLEYRNSKNEIVKEEFPIPSVDESYIAVDVKYDQSVDEYKDLEFVLEDSKVSVDNTKISVDNTKTYYVPISYNEGEYKFSFNSDDAKNTYLINNITTEIFGRETDTKKVYDNTLESSIEVPEGENGHIVLKVSKMPPPTGLADNPGPWRGVVAGVIGFIVSYLISSYMKKKHYN